MRPGQTAPECNGSAAVSHPRNLSFNEAGADCPGMHLGIVR